MAERAGGGGHHEGEDGGQRHRRKSHAGVRSHRVSGNSIVLVAAVAVANDVAAELVELVGSSLSIKHLDHSKDIYCYVQHICEHCCAIVAFVNF